jgi:hypothetical protein
VGIGVGFGMGIVAAVVGVGVGLAVGDEVVTKVVVLDVSTPREVCVGVQPVIAAHRNAIATRIVFCMIMVDHHRQNDSII